MPIRRAAATPPQEKPPSGAAEKEDGATPEEESPPPNESPIKSSAPETETKEGQSTDESEPTENGEKDPEEGTADDGKDKKADKCKDCLAGQCTTHCYVLLLRLKDGYKYKSKVKKVKRTIPAWASVTSNKKVPVTNYAGTQHKVDNILVEALTSFNSRSGVSYQSLMKYMIKKYPSMELYKKKFLIKKAMKKHLGNGSIKQLKGKGLSGTFAIGKVVPTSKKTSQNTESLGDALPLIITRLCEPKEASFGLIKKYLMQHFPALNIEKRPDILKSALGIAIEKGKVKQITGKGACGTFQLKRSGNQIQLKGSTLDDAIVAAITAMNEPKTCSTTVLRKHLLDANKDRKEHLLVSSLRRTLTKCKVLGWMEQISGHGFTGTYRLSFPYYPGPTVLYPDRFKDLEKPAAPKRRRVRSDDESESESEEEDEESEDEAPVRSRSKRPPPKARRPPQNKSRSVARSKSRGGKSSPAKKASPSKKVASKSSKKQSPAKKASSGRKGAAAKKPQTPAVKKLASRAAKRPPPKDLSSDEDEEEDEEEEEEEEEVAPKKTAKGRSSRSKSEVSPAPPAKKQATKSNSRAAPKRSKPAAKKGAKSSAQSARKSKRGRR